MIKLSKSDMKLILGGTGSAAQYCKMKDGSGWCLMNSAAANEVTTYYQNNGGNGTVYTAGQVVNFGMQTNDSTWNCQGNTCPKLSTLEAA